MSSPSITTESGTSGLRFRPFDETGHFHLQADRLKFRRLAMKGAGATAVAQGCGLIIQIVSTSILARLLVPSDFGLITMVTTFSLLLMNAGLNGFTEVLLQRQEVTDQQASNIFWINLGTGVVLTAVFAAAGSAMAWFYGNPLVTRVAAGISLTILATSTSVIHIALLMRGMRYPSAYANTIISRVLGMAASIALAYIGFGYWALVIGLVAQPVCESIGAWLLCGWVPRRVRAAEGTREMVEFAVHVYGRFSFNYFSRNVDNLLVGWRFNAQSLGFYKKAYDLFALSAILQSFTPVVISTLSRYAHDAKEYREQALKMLSLWSLMGMAAGGMVTLAGRDVIRILLGPGWDPAGRMFMLFGPGFGLMFIYGLHGWIHLSLGRPARWFRWGIFESVITTLLFVASLHWGPSGVAAAWTISVFILVVPSLWYAGRPVQLSAGLIVAAIYKYAVASLLAAAAVSAVTGNFLPFASARGWTYAALRIATLGGMFLAIYVALVVLFYRSVSPITRLVSLLRDMLPQIASSRSSRAELKPDPAGITDEQRPLSRKV